MKHRLLFIVILVLIVFTIGCAKTKEREADIEGYVMKVEETKFLVVSPVPISTPNTKEYYEALWVIKKPEKIELGQKVQVWIEGDVEESYPGRAGASKVEILPSTKHEGFHLTEEKAIQEGLKELGERSSVIAVKEITFDNKMWTILFKDTRANKNSEIEIAIRDKTAFETEFAPHNATEYGFVLDVHGRITYTEELERFYESVKNGQSGSLRVVSATIEGDPIVKDIENSGQSILITIDASRDTYGGGVWKMTCQDIRRTNVDGSQQYELIGCEGNTEAYPLVRISKQ